MKIPFIKTSHGKKILMVHEKPFYMLSGEVHNSNSSSVQYMEQVWEKAQRLQMNSLLLPVTWEMLEPEEGSFDFTLVDGLIEQARRRGKKLGFLWFGAWKNAQCFYAPEWVKTNLTRFRRAEMIKGKNFINLKDFHGMPYTTLSYLCEETKRADAKAFRELMNHLKEVDGEANTVVMVQVENETGVMGAAREYSDEADRIFGQDVPDAFIKYMKTHVDTMEEDVRIAVTGGAEGGNWEEVFGSAAEEIFSAYHIASYVNHVAKAGKEAYPLPMAVNCWLDKGERPGVYPSGGPVARMMEVWKYCAPCIEIICPDIYVPNFCEVCDAYIKMENPLFIPETATHSYAGPRQVYVIGHYHAMGYAPFGFEEMGEPFTATTSFLFGMDVNDPALITPQNVEEYAWFSRTLHEMMPVIGEKYGTDDLKAILCERSENTMEFGAFGFRLLFDVPLIQRKDGVCLIVKNEADTFYILVSGAMLIPYSIDPDKPYIDILAMEEGRFENGKWMMQRRLNGDEVTMIHYEKPTLVKIKLFAYS